MNAEKFLNVIKKKQMRTQLLISLVHELTHAIDPGLDKKPQESENYDSYINSDREFPAFVNMYIELINNNILKNPKLKEQILNSLRTGSKFPIKEIDNFINLLTPENKNKFLKLIYQNI